MTAESLHAARGTSSSRAQRLSSSMRAARLWPALVAACVLVAACGDDERATLSQTDDASRAPAAQAPLAQAVAPAQTIAILASPAQPLKQGDASASPAAAPLPAPLAPPVIHTVD